jgi:pimeloyl-ACP methyl ester carboxylesterase
LEIFYFGQEGHRKFGVFHRPVSEAHLGLVFCSAYGEEMVASYAPVARWAKELTQMGIAVFRYHPYGTGESDGTSVDFSLESAISDTVDALSYSRERMKLRHVGLVGMRFGGFVAVQAALRAHADYLVLWSPIISLRLYCRELLRMRLTTELIYKQADRVSATTRSMIEELEAGCPVDLLGHEMSPTLYRQMISEPPWPDEQPAGEILWLTRPGERNLAASIVAGWNKNTNRTLLQSFNEVAFWEDYSSEFPRRFAKATVTWLLNKIPH